MSEALLVGLLWLLISSVYLVDSLLLWMVWGSFSSSRVRQGWLALPLLFVVAALLFTPAGRWVAWLVAAVAALRLVVHVAGRFWIGRSLTLAPPALAERVGGLAARWGAPAPARVLVDPTDRWDPCVMGLVRPVLVLPVSVMSLPGARFEAVLAHELAHLSARDPLRLWLLGLARPLLGWHPAARRMIASLTHEIELAADQQAVAWLADAPHYVRTLGEWAIARAGRPAPYGVALTGGGVAPAGGGHSLAWRLESLLHPNAPPPHLRLPAWLPARAQGDRRPPSAVLVRAVQGVLMGGYLALFLLLTRLV